MAIGSAHIKGVLLDLDNTLYDYKKANEPAKRAVFSLLARRLTTSKSRVKKSFERGRTATQRDLKNSGASRSRLLYIQKTIEALVGRTDFTLSREAHELFWNTFLRHARLRPGVRAFLRAAKKIDLRIAIVSDRTTETQLWEIIHFRIVPLVDFLVTSEEVGVEKPDPRIFRLALQKLRMRPRDVVSIGDDYKKDIEGARRLGIRGIFFDTEGAMKNPGPGVMVAKNFHEVLDLVCR